MDDLEERAMDSRLDLRIIDSNSQTAPVEELECFLVDLRNP